MSDDADMNTDTTSYEPAPAQAPPPRRDLVRPTVGRSIAGVAAGLSAYLNMSVGWIRFGFLALSVFGGLGIVLYALAWLLIRDEREPDSIGERLFRDIAAGPTWIAVALVVLGAVVIFGIFPFSDRSLIWAAVLIGMGVLLYRNDAGSGRRQEPAGPVDPVPGARQWTDYDDAGGELPPPPPVPSEPVPAPAPPPPAEPPSILGRVTIGVALLALGVLAVFDNLTPIIDPQPRHYLALSTVVIGLGLLTGAFVGRARWMILLGVFLVPPLLASPLAEVDWQGRVNTELFPVELSELASTYQGGVGSFRFHLTETDWQGETVPLEVELGAGEIVVFVPPGVGVTGSASVGMGRLETPGGDFNVVAGVDRSLSIDGDRGTLDLDLAVGAGSIEIYIDEGPPPPDPAPWDADLDSEIDQRN